MVINVSSILVIQEAVRKWCLFPYSDHKYGCPNYGKKPTCPPLVKRVDTVFDLNKPHWFVVCKFDLEHFARKMQLLHPSWSDRQCRCCLYWQGRVRKSLETEVKMFTSRSLNGKTQWTNCPEAMGVNVFRTCHRMGIMIKKNPKDFVYKVAMVGYPNRKIPKK